MAGLASLRLVHEHASVRGEDSRPTLHGGASCRAAIGRATAGMIVPVLTAAASRLNAPHLLLVDDLGQLLHLLHQGLRMLGGKVMN